ncbi:MAG: 5-formyltetrahydrofolate cyclo-ligase [Lachnospiraceae bacterium]|nr:5-formyltetrahydrofolate cyclo-ligase [Lachnospiraceae bacterium]
MEDIKALKKEIRKDILKKRDALSKEEIKEAEKRLLKVFISENLLYGAKNVLLFSSFGSEIPTGPIFDYCMNNNIRTYYPKVIGDKIEFYYVYHPGFLEPNGYKGIKEPKGDSMKYDYEYYAGQPFFNTFIILPGACFDKEGNRLGYGGGFYDRYLAEKPLLVINSIAIGYKMQEVPAIPVDEHDIKPGKIILV